MEILGYHDSIHARGTSAFTATGGRKCLVENRTITKMQNTERRSFLQLAFAGHDDTLTISEKQQAAWMANLPIPMLGQYRSNLARLRGIAFDIGTQDFNPALLVQAHDLDAALTSNGIPHEFEEFTGTHTDKLAERVEIKLLPFFSRVLQ